MPDTNARLLSMKLSVSLARTFGQLDYRLESAYTRGFSQAALAEYLQSLPDYSSYGKNVLEHAVRYYLVGNDDPNIGPVFRGSIPKDIYAEHSLKHKSEMGKVRGKESLEKKTGIHAFDAHALRINAIKAAQSRGETPWEREEFSKVLSLALFEMFKMNGHVDYNSIAQTINTQFHDSKPVRTRVSTREALRRLQKSFSK